MSIVIIDQDIVHYEALGRGRPVVFLHTWIGSWRYWIPTMQAQSIQYRSYALDLWGFGDSAKKRSSYSLEFQSQLLKGFLDRLGIARVALIGHGLGALTAVIFSQQYPGYTDRVLTVSLPMTPRHIDRRLEKTRPSTMITWLYKEFPEQIHLDKTDPLAVEASLASIPAGNMLFSARRTGLPFLFVHGESDPLISPPPPDLQKTLPAHLHYLPLPESGHYPMLENKASFNRLLSDFLALHHDSSPRQITLKDKWKRRIR